MQTKEERLMPHTEVSMNPWRKRDVYYGSVLVLVPEVGTLEMPETRTLI